MDLMSKYRECPFREVKDGLGKSITPSRNAYYCGEIQDGVCNGIGVMYCADGSAFCGKFLYGKPYEGTYAYANGEIFDGRWKYDKPSIGIFRYKSGDVYDGTFENGGRCNGTYYFANGDVYNGGFDQSGRFSGMGVYTWKNGEKYDGNWYQGYRNGKGTMYYKNGTSKYCYWHKNQPTDW